MKHSSRPHRTAELSESLHQQLNMYALAATGAGVSLLALAQPVEAKIVYTKAHKMIEGKGSILDLDLNHDGMVDFQFAIASANSVELLTVYGDASGNRVWTSQNRSWAAAFPPGVRIGPSGGSDEPPKGGDFMEGVSCHKSSCHSFGNWLNVKNRYLGLAFVINGKTHYGWARLSSDIGDRSVRAVLTGYAYETIPGKAIITGRTKGRNIITAQPTTLGHLAAGASAIPALAIRKVARADGTLLAVSDS
jgi:hypothetical protein